MAASLEASMAAHQHLMHTTNKRISTLEYLRKAHEDRLFWFNTLLFEKPDLERMPYFEPRRMARRATNYLLLGLSLPAVVDLNSATPLDFLRTLNALLVEYDSFQQLHSGSLSRARLPQMFRRATTSTAAAVPAPQTDRSVAEAATAAGNSRTNTFAIPADDLLLPGEEYAHLRTPSLPFDPDLFETFATLCDVLIDCYHRLLSLVPTPSECSSVVSDLFAKVDGRIRKLIVQSVVKEFEDASRAQIKAEMAGIGRVVLAGLL